MQEEVCVKIYDIICVDERKKLSCDNILIKIKLNLSYHNIIYDMICISYLTNRIG